MLRAVNSDGAAENALPGASTITVTVEKGTPSAEGPLTTTAGADIQLSNLRPAEIQRAATAATQTNKNCSPFDDWYLEFNNSIDASKFTKEMIKIEPAVEGLNIYPSGNYVYIQGYKKGRTTYKVTVDGSDLRTSLDRRSANRRRRRLRSVSAEAEPLCAGRLHDRARPDGEADVFDLFDELQRRQSAAVLGRAEGLAPVSGITSGTSTTTTAKRPTIPGRLVSDKVVTIKDQAGRDGRDADRRLGQALDGGFGNVIVDIEPTVRKDKYDRTRIFTWLQATQIGLDAFVDNTELVGFATELKTGKPLAGVDLSIYPNGKIVSRITAASRQPGVIEQAWNWLTSWGSERANEIEALRHRRLTDRQSKTVRPAQYKRTGNNGILRLPLPDTQSDKGQNILIARRGKDVAFLPENTEYYWQDTRNLVQKARLRFASLVRF